MREEAPRSEACGVESVGSVFLMCFKGTRKQERLTCSVGSGGGQVERWQE